MIGYLITIRSSFTKQAMLVRQQQICDIVRQDPDVQSVSAFVGGGTVNPTINSGRGNIVLKPRKQRPSNADQIITRLRLATQNVQGISLFMQAVQDLQIDPRVSRTQYQYTLEDTDSTELGSLVPKFVDK